jgi:hypothetical protein
MPDTDTKAIEDEVERTMAAGLSSFARRPKAVVVVDGEANKEAKTPEATKTQEAMNAVDRRAEAEGWQIEAYVDQAIHTRIVAARGAYLPGPRDAYVRRMVLEWLNTITHSNSHTLDR